MGLVIKFVKVLQCLMVGRSLSVGEVALKLYLEDTGGGRGVGHSRLGGGLGQRCSYLPI